MVLDKLWGRGSPEWCYEHDTDFHAVVDMIEAMLHRAQMTPGEIRTAATLACIHYEMRRLPQPIRIEAWSRIIEAVRSERGEERDDG